MIKSIIGFAVVLIITGILAYWLVAANKSQMIDYCNSKGATAVRTAPNTYNCYTDDGRLVP